MEEKKFVYLSPSLQDWNVGINDYGTEEQRMNEVADVVERKLKEKGYIVKRNNPNNKLSEVVKESNMFKPDIHVALHSNASGPSGKGKGPEIYANRPNTSADKLAKLIYKEIEDIYPYKDKGRGVLYTTSLYEIVRTDAPAVLLEVAFHDEKDDAKWIIDNIEEIANAVVKGIDNYFKK